MKVQFYSVFAYRVRDGRWEFLGTCHPHLESFNEIGNLPDEQIKLPKTMLLGREQTAKVQALPYSRSKIYYVPTSW
jgi:hypothetical protein